jgi:ABC-type antimicrobial peptide transport system permease subunit
VVGAGAALGAGLALVGGRFLADLLFGVTAADPPVYAVVVVTLGVAGALAGLVPARRATRVDPRTAMQAE